MKYFSAAPRPSSISNLPTSSALALSLLLALTLATLFTGCKSDATTKATMPGATKTAATQTASTATSATTATATEMFKLTETAVAASALEELITKFDDKICEGSEKRDISECYQLHSHEMKMDLMNNRPYTLAFPYDDSFDLSMVSNIDSIAFLTKNCGMKIEDTEEVLHYHCLRSDSKFMDYLQREQSNSELMMFFYEDYKKNKTISSEFKQGLLMTSDESLDFKNKGHRIFYMLLHLMVNEERIATTKIQKG